MTEKDDVMVAENPMAAGELTGTEHASNSVVTERKDVVIRMGLVSFAVFAGASSYIIMLFVAMPLAIHLIVNTENGCDNDAPDADCFAPTKESEEILTLVLSLLRFMTFLFGSLVGTLSDKFGRKPLLVFALSGYCLTGILFAFGWDSQTVALFFVGGMVLGASSPITPHGVAYVSDISEPSILAHNLGVLQGLGYFFGLMGGALIALGIGALSTKDGSDGEPETDYDQLFYLSFGIGSGLSGLAGLLTLFVIPESLNKKDRVHGINIKKANPLAFIPMVTRNMYIFLIWLSAVIGWISVGAAEVVTGGWWLRRYVMTDVNDFIQYIVLLWVASGFGAAICTPIYLKLSGLKGALHISTFFTIVVGVAFALAPDATTSYIAVGLSFFAAPLLPTTFAILMRQVGPKEKGALAGALRSSEALAKFIGILAFGNIFAAYIAPFTPNSSCIPAGFNPNVDETNTCECGVESCPIVRKLEDNTITQTLVPSECRLGQLSATFHGKPSKSIPFKDEGDLDIFANADPRAQNRPDSCLGAGLLPNKKGFPTSIPRQWCASASRVGETGNLVLGCPGFDLVQAGNDELLLINQAICAANLTSLNCNATRLNDTLFHQDLALMGAIAAEIFDPNKKDLDYCPQFPDAEINVCMEGPITEFPGLLPLIYMAVTGVIGWIVYIIAECFFISGDEAYLKTTGDVNVKAQASL